MLLYIYIGSTLYVWVDTIAHQIYLDRRLKKEGYRYTQKNYFSFADIILGLLYLSALSVPVFNLLFPLSHINKDRSYDEYMNYLDEAGSIEKIEPEEKSNLNKINNMIKLEKINNNGKEKNIIRIDKSELEERISRNGNIYYSSLQNDENDHKEYTYQKTLKR